MLAHSSLLAMAHFSPCFNPSGSLGSTSMPFSPLVMSSRATPTFVTTAVSPQANASTTAMPKPSYSLGNTNTSAACRYSWTLPTSPGIDTLCSKPCLLMNSSNSSSQLSNDLSPVPTSSKWVSLNSRTISFQRLKRRRRPLDLTSLPV